LFKIGGCEFSGEINSGGIEFSEKNEIISRNLVMGSNVGIKNVSKLNVIEKGGNLFINFESITITVSEENGKEFIFSFISFNSIYTASFSGRWLSLLFNPTDDS